MINTIFTFQYVIARNDLVKITRVGPTGFLQSDDDAKLKIDEF